MDDTPAAALTDPTLVVWYDDDTPVTVKVSPATDISGWLEITAEYKDGQGNLVLTKRKTEGSIVVVSGSAGVVRFLNSPQGDGLVRGQQYHVRVRRRNAAGEWGTLAACLVRVRDVL